jgi:hypothetical protein
MKYLMFLKDSNENRNLFSFELEADSKEQAIEFAEEIHGQAQSGQHWELHEYILIMLRNKYTGTVHERVLFYGAPEMAVEKAMTLDIISLDWEWVVTL